MRARIPKPPGPDELLALSPHETVRDFPETLPVFRSHGLSLPEVGARPLARILEEGGADDPEALIRDLRSALDWRREA